MKCYGFIGFLVLALILSFAAFAKASPPDLDGLYDSISAVESNNGKNASDGDNGKSIGHFQIQYCYWLDATHRPIYKLGKVIGYKRIHDGDYDDVRTPAYARQVMLWYWQRYAAAALEQGDWQTLARVHNGGPNGARMKSTEMYWYKVKAVLEERGYL